MGRRRKGRREITVYWLFAVRHSDVTALSSPYPVHIWKSVFVCGHTQMHLHRLSPLPLGACHLPGTGLGASMYIIFSEVSGRYTCVFQWIISSYLFFPLRSTYFLPPSQWNAKPVLLEFVLSTPGWQGDALLAQWCLPSLTFSHPYLILLPSV